MARFCGYIGFVNEEESKPGVWTPVPTERKYRGDVIRNIRRSENNSSINDDVSVNNVVEIVADDYAKVHMSTIRYVKWMGAVWKVTTTESRPPRLVLTLGGVYNGPTA